LTRALTLVPAECLRSHSPGIGESADSAGVRDVGRWIQPPVRSSALCMPSVELTSHERLCLCPWNGVTRRRESRRADGSDNPDLLCVRFFLPLHTLHAADEEVISPEQTTHYSAAAGLRVANGLA
jgi:hypothetical protein